MVTLRNLKERVKLAPLTTMKVGGTADYFVTVTDIQSVKEACDWASEAGVPVFVLGEGSNLVVSDRPIHRLVLKMEIMGFEKVAETATTVTWKVGAGEHWDGVVERSVKLSLTGIEAMSMIPGTMGAAPVQNAGAYGQEIADSLVELEAYDLAQQKFVTLKASECDFAYRNSTFKTDNAGRYVITHVTLRLGKADPKPPTYESLKRWLDDKGIERPTVEQIREGVMAVRARILPDPSVVPNSGSFFKSPIVSAAKLAEIEKEFHRVPSFRYGDEYKIAAGWIVEQCGFKGTERFGLKVWDNHALVITNPNGAGFDDLKKLVDAIVAAAKEKFGLELEYYGLMNTPDMLDAILVQLSKLRDPGGYFNAGIPNYDHLFGRDSCVTALQMLHREPEAAKATLLILAKFQGKKRRLRREEWPGKIMHEHYPYGLGDMLDAIIHNDHPFRHILNLLLWRFPYYGSVDAGAWFLILLHHYYRRTNDKALVQQLWPNVLGIIRWYDRHGTHKPHGLVTFRSHFFYGLKIQSWKDGGGIEFPPPVAMVEVQGYYYYALKLAAELAEDVIGDASGAAELLGRANTLKADFQAAFVPVDGLIPMAIDGNDHSYAIAASNIGHLLFTGILDKPQCEAVVRRLFAPDMITPYGVRTESTKELSFDPLSYQNGSVWPFDNWVIHQGLLKVGYTVEAKQIKDGFISVFEQWKQFPELYAVSEAGELGRVNSACRIQAWSAGALVNLLEDAPLI